MFSGFQLLPIPSRWVQWPGTGCFWYAAFLITFLLVGSVYAQSDYLTAQQLRTAGKFASALKHATDSQAQVPEKSPQFIRWQLEVLKTQTAILLTQSSSKLSGELQTFLAESDQFVDDHRAHQDLLLVKVQIAVSILTVADLLNQQRLAGESDLDQTKEIVDLIRESEKRLRAVQRQLADEIPGRPRKRNDGFLDQNQMFSLQNRTRLLIAKSRIERAGLYPANSTNRISLLTSARKDLENLIPLIAETDPDIWVARMELLRGIRMSGDLKTAAVLFKSFPIAKASADMRLTLKAERLHLAVEQQDWKTANSLVESGRVISGRKSPDLDLAILEYLLRQAAVAKDDQQRELQAAVPSWMNVIEKEHSAVWQRRANLMLLKYPIAKRNIPNASAATAIRIAKEFYRKKDWQNAIKHYKIAADSELANKNDAAALELEFQILLIRRGLGQHQTVSDQASELSRKHHDLKRAAVVNLTGLLSSAELVRQQKLSLEKYEAGLRNHLDSWPKSETSLKVAAFLMRFQFAKKRPFEAAESALSTLENVKPEEDASVMRSRENLVELWLKSFEAIAHRPIREQESFRQSFSPKLTAILASRDPMIAGAIFYGLENDESIFQKGWLLADTMNLEQSRWQDVYLRARTRLAKSSADLEFLNSLDLLTQIQAERLLMGWRRDYERSPNTSQEIIANGVVRLAEKFSVPAEAHLFLAECHRKLGNQKSALAALKSWRSAMPDSIDSQRQLGKYFATDSDPGQRKKAIDVWRSVTQKSKPMSEVWFESKYQTAYLLSESGDKKRSLQILEYLRAVPPGWNQSGFRAEFEQLYQSLKK